MRRALLVQLPIVILLIANGLLVRAQSAQLGTTGTRFWTALPAGHGGSSALTIHISGTPGTNGTVSVPRAGWSQAYTVPADGVKKVLMPTTVEHLSSGVVEGKGILVEADHTVSVVALRGSSFASEGTVVLPEPALGVSYRAISFTALQGFGDLHRSELVIVATEDGTEVRITAPVPLTGPSGTTLTGPVTVTLNAGESYQVQPTSSQGDLTGTLVEGTEASGPCRPFAVLSGATCASIPAGGACGSCNPLYDQTIPTTLWGSRYHFIPMGNAGHYSYRILAKENGTVVQLNGVPTYTLQAGQFAEATGVPTLHSVVANKPVSVVQFHEGTLCSNNSGDPSMFSLLADHVTTRGATLATLLPPGTTTATYSISLVTTSAGLGQIQLNGTPVPTSSFTAYTGSPGYYYASVNVPAGTHRVTSTVEFQAYMVFRGQGDAYIYPASESVYIPENTDTLLCNNTSQITVSSPIYLENASWYSTASGTILGTGNTLQMTLTGADTLRLTGTLPVSGCPRTFNIFVGLTLGGPGGPTVDVTANGAQETTVCQYGSVQLASQPAFDPAWFNLQWTPAISVGDPHASQTPAYPTSDTWYRLQVTSPTGCGSGTDSVLVHVTPNDLYGVQASSANEALCLGNSTQLNVKAQRVFRTDRFEGAPANWWTISGGTLSNACGAVSGTSLYFNGASTRSATTSAMDLSAGGWIHFALKIANGAPPCDDADAGENVVVESSLNGSTWTVLSTLHENAYPTFSAVHVQFPALNTSARLRIRQLTHSGAGQDNWSIDDVVITRFNSAGLITAWTPSETLTGNNTMNPVASPTANTLYTAMVSTAAGCSFSDQTNVTVGPAFSILPIADTIRCGTPAIQLGAQTTSGNNIQWTWTPANGSLSSTTIAAPVATPSTTTTYTVNATNDLGCTDSEQFTIGVSQLSAVTLASPDLQLCQGESTQLTATITAGGPVSVQWSPTVGVSAPTSASTSVQPNATTNYTCTVTDVATGCSIIKNITVTVTTAYTATLQNDTTLCSVLGHQLGLQHNVPGSPTYVWSHPEWLNAGNIQQPTILEDTSATWTVTITDANGCSVTASTTLSVAFDNLVTPVNVGTCTGQPMVLDAEFPGCLYEWTTGATSQTIAVEDPGPYTVMITDAQLCQVVKTFIVSFHALPDIDLGPDLALCGQTQHLLDAHSIGNNVTWNTGGSGQQLLVTSTGEYWATATTGHGCSRTDSIHLSIDPLPVDALSDLTACIESPPTLNAGNPGASYLWSTGDTTQSIMVTTLGTVSVTVTTPANCSATFDAQIVLMPMVVVDLGADTTLCAGQPLVLDPDMPGLSHTWNTGGTAEQLPVTSSGTYSVVVSNGYCSGSDQRVVVFDPIPVDQLTDITSCIDQPVTLHAGNNGSQYLWNTGSTAEQITALTAGTYSVTITNQHGCAIVANATVAYVGYPIVDLGPARAVCLGQHVLLDAGNTGATHLWSNHATTSSISVGSGGTYWVAVDNGYCIARDTVMVRVDPVPARLPQHSVRVCLDDPPRQVELDAGNPGCTYAWSTGDTSRTIQATYYGTFEVVVTNAFGCTLLDDVVVVEACIPTLYLPNTFTPNNDGLNDVWLPVGKNIGELELLVFDRWGSVIFKTTDPATGWDGTINGNPARNEVYAWKLRWRPINNTTGLLGFEQEESGHVQIMR